MNEVVAHALELILQGVLEIREDGSIWRLKKFRPSGECKPCIPHRIDKLGRGYFHVQIGFKGKQRTISSNRLVYAWYHSELNDELEVDHINDNPLDNSPNNLQQLTHKSNITKHGGTWVGKKHTEETKLKMSVSQLSRYEKERMISI